MSPINFSTLNCYFPKAFFVKAKFTLAGCRTCALFLEQRVYYVIDGGEQSRNHADYVSTAVPHLKGALESNYRCTRL